MKLLNSNKSRALMAASAAAFLTATLTPIAAYAVNVTDLYIMQGEELYRVNETTGAYTLVGSNDDWEGFTSLTGDGGYGAYAIQGDSIWYVSFLTASEGATTLISDDGWTGPTQLAYGEYLNGFSVVESLTVWQGGYLYKVTPSTGAVAQLGSAPWAGQAAMVYLNDNNNGDGNDLFVVQDDALWRVNVNNGSYAQVGTGDWSDTTAMTTDGIKLYIAAQNHLYAVNPSTGSSTDLGGGWNTTTTLTFFNSWLYAIDGADLFRVNSSTGSTSLLGSADEWPGFTLMTFRNHIT